MTVRSHHRVLAVIRERSDLELLRMHVAGITDWDTDLQGFTDPRAALRWLDQGTADLILIDYFLGPVSGRDLIQAIRSRGANAPVVFLTGHGDETLAVAMLQDGVADCLPRSAISTSSLRRSMANAIEKHRLAVQAETWREEAEAQAEELRRKESEIQTFLGRLNTFMKPSLDRIEEAVASLTGPQAGTDEDAGATKWRDARFSVERLERFAANLEIMNELDRGRAEVRQEAFDLGRILRTVVAGFAVEAAWKGVRLVVDLPTGLPAVRGDARLIRQVVVNLVDNAVRATPADGEVAVGAEFSELSDDLVRVTVCDSGHGISPALQKRLFVRSLSGRRKGSFEPDGMGLGLPVCQTVLEHHRETLVVQSAPGQGSVFVFVLPATRAAAHPQDDTPDRTRQVRERIET